MNLFDRPLVSPLNPKSIIALKNPATGKIINAEVATIMDQIFDLGLLGQSCLQYPTTTVTDCDGNNVVLPLQIAQVLLLHEQKICEALNNISYLENTFGGVGDAIGNNVYSEFIGEPDEWTVTENTGGANITLNSSSNPNTGSVSIEINESDLNLDNEIVFTEDSNLFVENIKELRFYLNNENNTSDYKITITFRKGVTQVAQPIVVQEGLFGFSNNNDGYREIIVPILQSIFSDVDYDNFIMTFTADTDTEALTNIFLDDVVLYYNPATVFDNIPPTVSASSDQTIQLPTSSVNLNSLGEDVDGVIVSYLWEKLSGGNAVIANSTFSSTAVTGLEEGTYTFKVTVTDNEGATASDIVFVTVLPLVANIAPVADAGSNQLIYLPTNSVSLNGSGFDTDGYITTYLWEKISGGAATINNPNAATTTVTALVEDTYVFRLTVTDNNGATGTDEVTVTVGDGANLVAVNIEIDQGDCDNPPDWVGVDSVWISDLASVASGGDFNQQNGDVIYTDNTLTTPFNGGDQVYSFRGVSPTQIVHNRTFRVSALGVISEMNECTMSDQVLNMNYDSSSNFQPDTYEDLTYAILANGYSNNSGSPVAKFKIKSLPSRGELGLQGTEVVVNQEIPLSQINNNYFAFWADELDGLGLGGDYSTSFTYTIIDTDGVESNLITLDINATDTTVPIDVTFFSPIQTNGCYSQRYAKVNVPIGETREVNITKIGSGNYFAGLPDLAVEGATIVTQNITETIFTTKIYSIGVDATTGSGNSSTTITVSTTEGNQVILSRLHQDPVVNC